MGSALASVAAENNEVVLVGSPLDSHIIECLQSGKSHPTLRHQMPENIASLSVSEVDEATLQNAEVIVLGVASPGVDWALDILRSCKATPNILALVTKGLVGGTTAEAAPRTYAQTLDSKLTMPHGRIVGIGGPCIAREMALGYPTRVCFAASDINVADQLSNLLKSKHYHIATHTDFTGLEACAALKNFMCIGVSTAFTAYTLDDGYAKNPLAALFNQAVLEISKLTHWIKQETGDTNDDTSLTSDIASELAFDLPGMGDLHVTVGGGRNSLLGRHLGHGRRLNDILQTDMHNTTVEGVDTARQLCKGFRYACEQGVLDSSEYPLTKAILDVVEFEQPFKFEFSSLPI